jgi:predicted Zn finger-like uncharacterized protein
MPSIIACPACAGQLRLPDELLGQQVRCPTCSNVFTAVAPPDTASAAPPDLSLGNGNGHEPEPAAAKTRGLVGAVELNLSLDDADASRSVPARSPEPPLPEPPSHPRWRNEDEAEREPRGKDHDSDRFRLREPERRDREPGRGVLILVLGIISLSMMVVIWPLCPLGAILGLVAWVMGHNDLKKIKANQLDPDASGLTKAGWICGIIGTFLNSLIMLSCGGFLTFVLLSTPSRPATTYKQPVQFNVKDIDNKPPIEVPRERRKDFGPPRPRMKDKNADKDIL